MPDKAKTVVVIESHEQTIIRRSRRVISSQLAAQATIARPQDAQPGSSVGVGPSARTSSVATKRLAQRNPRWLVAWCRAVALKGVSVFAQWPRC
jgi:hypothetical protein